MSISYFKDCFSSLTLASGDFVADTTSDKEAPLDPAFVENMQYAEEAMEYTHKILPLGASNVPNPKVSSSEIRAMKLEALVTCIARALFLHFQWNKPLQAEIQEMGLNVIFECAKKHKMGNCGEHSIIAFCYLKNDKRISNLDCVELVNGDHGFTIIGRKVESDLMDPATWGKAAVVCDAWARIIYPASEFSYNMKETCRVYNIALSEDEPRVRLLIEGVKRPNETAIKPILTEEKELALQNKLKNYHSLKNKIQVHDSLEKQAKIASAATAGVGILALLSRRRSGYFIAGGAFALSAALYSSSGFFPKHAKMYGEKLEKFWQKT